ncbi:indolepyruvate oxidoreductase subunit beta family protein [Ottowia sp. GY511]|uniref:Indolepyruvate oxidoreductase subunit beta family protein n=1 Tax=Ottowia flava TaxID=2675430 RepID=A0ABW4KU94_9BURK|nr:indolepyruvate oxidoreductase subunit beta family protein [Ottowia sp. GY511]TXK33611.1 indolepyruvate oxidoreductase subunit beta family protein [Ottowia sp. GY511]
MKPRLITIAVLALGGQGGGVLVDWIVDLAEHAGWTAQATSVAGVAQRTGATIYYIELAEPTPGREPVLALMPVPGEVDILIAAELMEAGRSVERGFVTPNRTTVITSSHRTYAVQEKMAPGNGTADSSAVLSVVQTAAQRVVADDMQALAVRHGSVISACLFGALAGSGVLPFDAADFEAVVERGGVGVKPSLAAMRAAALLAREQQALPTLDNPADAMQTAPRALPERVAHAPLEALVEQVRREFPAAAWNWLGEGLARVTEWQDVDYGHEYLSRVRPFADSDAAAGDASAMLTIAAARWIAVAMAYDDVIRVADLKTRATRDERVRGEVGAGADDVLGLEEFFHPRLEEVLGLLPERWAKRIESSPWLSESLQRRLAHGRRIQTHTIGGFLQLRMAAGLRRWRRGSRRHAAEVLHLEQWLAEARRAVNTGDRALAAEILHCRRLVKGYSDTHARGQSRFDRLMHAARRLEGRPEAAARLRELREAALKDAEGRALDVAERALFAADALAVPPR